MVCLPLFLKLMTLFVCISGGVIGYLVSDVNLYFFNRAYYFYKSRVFLGSIWFIPVLSTYGVVRISLSCGGGVIKSFDQG